MPSQTLNVLDAVDEVDLAQVQILISIFLEYKALVYGERADEGVVK
jgi:hypothetical protein